MIRGDLDAGSTGDYTCRSHGGRLAAEELSLLVTKLEASIDGARRIAQVHRNAEADALWRSGYEALSQGGIGLHGALTSRAEAQALRISLLYALLDCSREIRREHLEAALAVWRYCDQSVRYIFGDAIGDATADRILEAFRRSPEGMTRTEISGVFGRHLKSQELDRALSLLERLGRITAGSVETNGRPETRYFAR